MPLSLFHRRFHYTISLEGFKDMQNCKGFALGIFILVITRIGCKFPFSLLINITLTIPKQVKSQPCFMVLHNHVCLPETMPDFLLLPCDICHV